MNYSNRMELFDAFVKQWKIVQSSLTKKDVSYIAFKDSFRHGMRGFLTLSYYKRERLIRNGDLVFGYTFKCWSDESNFSKDYPTWVLFSPSLQVSKNPGLLAKTGENLLKFARENKDKKYRKLCNLINEPLSDCDYFEIPQELTGGVLVYLSIIYLHVNQIENFQMGINPLIISKGISAEVIYLPDKYWIPEFLDLYNKHRLF